MADINISATVSCDSGGGVITGTWDAVNVQDAVLTITGNLTAYESTENYTTVSGGSFTFSGLADDLYDVYLTGTIDGQSEILMFEVSCGPPPPACDLQITSVTTTQTSNGLDNGSATINATGTGTIQYSLNGTSWQSSNTFTWLPVGTYTAYIRKLNQESCGDFEEFEITRTPILGCTNPEADNYNPAATQDNGLCLYTSKFYACGGVLPNPVPIQVNFAVTDGGVTKANHYVKLNIYKTGESTPFATATQTLRNGSASVDISRYLRNQFNNAYQEPTAQVIYKDEAQSFGFYIGIIEYYNGVAQPERLKTLPPRVAVNAALPEYADTVEPYLIKGTSSIPEETETPPEL